MFFDLMIGDIGGEPGFNQFFLEDVNPLSGNVKRRRIYAPNESMREVHERFIAYLRRLKIGMPNATGGVPGMSPIRNVLRHRLYGCKNRGVTPFRRFFYLLDIKGAYQSVDVEKLAAIIWHYNRTLPGDESGVLEFLNRFCISREEGGLIVGAPASPDLFNIYCAELLDPFLRPLCEKYSLTYTRYIDDLTFSSQWRIGSENKSSGKRRAILGVIRKAGFEISYGKARVLDLNKGPIVVNGVGITKDGKTFLPRSAACELRGLLHLALNGRPISKHVIHGKMGLFRSLTDCRRCNGTENRILEMYRKFMRMSS